MRSIQKLLYTENNACAPGTIAATGTKPASNTVKRTGVQRAGTSTGLVTVTGDYTGDNDSDLDVEILSGGTGPRTSLPIFTGAGNGDIDSVSANATVADQDFVITLIDLGVDDATAAVDFFGVVLQARAIGAAGNNIRLEVDNAGINKAVIHSLPAAVNVDDARLEGDQWDLGALPLTANGELDPNTIRLCIGDDPQVYRQYKQVENGREVYYFDPPIARASPQETPVYQVTGSYEVTVTDGSTSTIYAAIVTLYDLLVALYSDPLLTIAPGGVVIEDKSPGGMAAEDLPLRTHSYANNLQGDGSVYVDQAVASMNVTAIDATITQQIRLVCQNNDTPGAETWTMRGAASGPFADQQTGISFSGSGISFTIPQYLSGEPVQQGDIVETGHRFQSAGVIPHVCDFYKPILGSKAVNKTLTLTWHLVEQEDCCDVLQVEGEPNEACLGVPITGEAVVLDPDFKSRADSWLTWSQAAKVANTSIILDGASPDLESHPDYDFHNHTLDLLLVDNMTSIFVDTLAKITDESITGADRTAALAIYDAIETSAQSDVATALASGNYLNSANPDSGPAEVVQYVGRWQDELNRAQVAAGIDPFDTAGITGTGCWQDLRSISDGYFSIIDSDGMSYLPLWRLATGSFVYYHSAVQRYVPTSDSFVIESTKEFGFGLRICDAGNLVELDTITIQIVGAVQSPTYLVGDELSFSVVANDDLYLLGGVSGDNTHVWSVYGSVLGQLSNYTVVDGSEVAYGSSGIQFRIFRGALKNSIGDTWQFNTARGQYRYRRDSGAWSSPADIPDTPVVIGDGLSLSFVTGDGVSFEDLDLHSFAIAQPYSPGHVLTGDWEAWRLEADAGSLTIDFVNNQDIEFIAIPRHTLPSGAGIAWTLLTASDVLIDSGVLTWASDVIVAALPAVTTARKLRLDFTDGNGGSVQWVYAGLGLDFSADAGTLTMRRVRAMAGAGGIANRQSSLGRGYSGVMEWATGQDNGWFSQTDIDALANVFEYVKSNNDEPFVLIPNYNEPAESALVRWDSNNFDVVDDFSYSEPKAKREFLSISIPLGPVYQ